MAIREYLGKVLAAQQVTLEERPSITKPTQRLRPEAKLVVAAGAVLLAGRLFLAVFKYAVNVFYWDQWDFMAAFFRHSPGFAELFFWQHGPIREGVGLFLDKLLYPVIQWNSRFDSFTIAACIFIAMLLALRLKQKLFGSITYLDVAIPIIFLRLSQAENIVNTPNPAYAGFPLLMMMMYCLALLQRNRLLRYSLVLLLNFLLIYTAFGLFMGVITLGVFLLEGWRSVRGQPRAPIWPAATGIVIAAASLGSFFVHYRFQSSVDCFVFPYHPVIAYPEFVLIMFGGFLAPSHSMLIPTLTGIGVLLGLMLILGHNGVRLLSSARSSNKGLVEVVLVGYSLAFSVNAAVGRVCLPLPITAEAGRYVTLLIPAFLAIYFYLASIPSAPLRKLALPLFCVVLLPTAVVVYPSTVRLANFKRAWAACYRRIGDIGQCDRVTGAPIYPAPAATELKQKLDFLKMHRLNLFSGPAE